MPDNSIKFAQAAGILGSAYFGGQITGISIMTIHTMLVPSHKPAATLESSPGTPTSHLAHQWLSLYAKGKSIFPAVCTATSAAFWYLAWAMKKTQPRRAYLYAVAAGSTMGIIPFTILVMHRVNKALMDHGTRHGVSLVEANDVSASSGEELAERKGEDDDLPTLMRKWSHLNLVRGALPLLGAAIGVYATVFM